MSAALLYLILCALIFRFCRGCKIECCDADFNFGCAVIAIDWDPTALHLRYQTSLERVHIFVSVYCFYAIFCTLYVLYSSQEKCLNIPYFHTIYIFFIII